MHVWHCVHDIPLVMEFSQNYPLNSYGIAFVLIVAVAVVVAVAAVVVVAVVVDLYRAFYCTPFAIDKQNHSSFISMTPIHVNVAQISTC